MTKPIKPIIGILALQGNYQTHYDCIKKVGCDASFIQKPDELNKVDGLILPGGESGVILKHFSYNSAWISAIENFYKAKKPILATCAGIILLAKEVIPSQFSFGFLNITVKRNAYGRQLESANRSVQFFLDDNNKLASIEKSVSFIRAPKIQQLLSEDVKVIAKSEGEIVGVKEGNIFALTCHPEYTTTVVHQAFVDIIKK